jgi:hypothetical protein
MSEKIKITSRENLKEVLGEELYKEVMEDILKIRMTTKNDDVGEWSSSNSPELPTSNYYKLVDASEFPFGTYIQKKTGGLVSQHFTMGGGMVVTQSAIEQWLDTDKFKKIFTRDYVTKGEYFSTSTYEMEKDGGVLLLSVSDILNDFSKNKAKIGKNEVYITIVGNIDETTYKEVIDSIVVISTTKKQEENNVALVIQTQRGYDTQTFELPKQKLNIDLNYGKDFKPVHDKIIKQLNEPNGKGLVLLHGVPGGGKTHYLKYLASKIKDKQVLFIPPYLADFITSPEMTPFLIQNSNSVLFIEDAENVITDRNINGSNGVSNILNITDGILSDILKIQVVATFNMDKAKIDSALLRKGRLIAEHKFDALPVDDANALLKHLGKEENATKPMTLTEIYNVDEEEFKSEDEKPKIGFGR